jgi:hypothetical protein
VLGLGCIGDLAADPREAEDPDAIPLVGVADQIELTAPVDQVVGVHLALLLGVPLDGVVGELDRLPPGDRGLDLRESLGDLRSVRLGGHPHLDRGSLRGSQRARTPPRDLLQRQAQRLRVGELAVEKVKRRLQRRQLVIGEADLRQVVVLRGQRVELGLIALHALAGLLHLQGDAEGVELGAVGVEASREGVVVHVAVPLHLALYLERRGRPALSHEVGDQRELADQLLGVLGHARGRIDPAPRRPIRS